MWPVLGGLISGGANLLGGFFSSQTSAQNTQAQIAAQEQMQGQSEAFNAQQAQISRDYQTQMSNTAYQRASADMKAAGLNPMMMFGSGGPASVPSGSTASIGTPTAPMPTKTSALAQLGPAVDHAMSSAISMKTMDKMTEEISNLIAGRLKTGAETRATEAGIPLTQAQTRATEIQGILRKLEIPGAELTAAENEQLNQWRQEHPILFKSGVVGAYGGRKASDIIDPIAKTISAALPLRRVLTQGAFTSKDPDQTIKDALRQQGWKPGGIRERASFGSRFLGD